MSTTGVRRLGLPLVLAYPPLALLGAFTHHTNWYVAALLALLAGLGLFLVGKRSPVVSLAWLALTLAALAAIVAGRALLILDVIPVVANLALAWLFGHTLRAGSRPLVARLVAVVESEEHLGLPGMARYARQVTWFWALLLLAQALLTSVLLVCAVPGGVLASLGVASPLPVPQTWTAWYMHLGAWLVPVLAMVLEYAFRRWHMRHVPQVGLHHFILRLAACWPRLIRGIVTPVH